MTEPAENSALEGARKRRRGCLLRIIAVWILIWAVVVSVILVVRLGVETDADAVSARAHALTDFDLPERFKPYRASGFWGIDVITYWDMENLHEDGRSKAVIAIQRNSDWRGKSLEALSQELLGDMESRLGELEFKTRATRVETLDRNGETMRIHLYSGIQKTDADLEEATCCFRLISTPKGNIQVQTIGLDAAFPPQEQIETLAGFQAARTLSED